MAKRSTSPGRPAGSPNVTTTAEASPSRCPQCDSTKRGPYLSRQEQEYSGTHDGQPYTHIVRRRCECRDCGQMRIDRTFENHPQPAAARSRKK